MPTNRTQVRYTFGDRGGNTATLTVWVSASLSLSELTAFVNNFASLVTPLTNGVILAVDCYTRHKFEDTPVASVDADVNARIVLYYSNGETYEAIWIPAPKLTLFESTGVYAGIRANRLAPELQPWIVDAAANLSILSTPEGDPFPSLYTVGGFAQ